jgi:hypothetical protein
MGKTSGCIIFNISTRYPRRLYAVSQTKYKLSRVACLITITYSIAVFM